ncbi:hypothetical protein D3C76_1634150 [compost metagenome]
MRIKQISEFIVTLSDCSEAFIIFYAVSDEIIFYLLKLISRDHDLAFILEAVHERGYRVGILTMQIVQVTFKIAGNLNVHGRTVGHVELAWLVHAFIDEALQNVIFVSSKD